MTPVRNNWTGVAIFVLFCILIFMVVRMRHTRSHTKNRRSHHALSARKVFDCKKCGAPTMRHTMCLSCGSYRGRTVVDVVGQELKRKEKKVKIETRAKEAEGEEEKKSINPEELSRKT